MRVGLALDAIDPQVDLDNAIAGIVKITETDAVLAAGIDAAGTMPIGTFGRSSR